MFQPIWQFPEGIVQVLAFVFFQLGKFPGLGKIPRWHLLKAEKAKSIGRSRPGQEISQDKQQTNHYISLQHMKEKAGRGDVWGNMDFQKLPCT